MKKINPNQSIYQAFSAANKDHGDIPAIEYFGNVITYGEAEIEIDRYAQSFKALMGDSKGTVSFCVPPIPAAILGFYALNKLGITANYISSALLGHGGAHHLAESNTETLVVADIFYAEIAESLTQTNVQNVIIVSLSDDIVTIPEYTTDRIKQILAINGSERIKTEGAIPGKEYYSLAEFLDLGKDSKAEIVPFYEPEKTAVVLYTGGSTGVPKGVEKRDSEVIHMSNRYPKIPIEAGTKSRVGIFIPPNHPTAFVHSVMVPLFFGSTAVPQPFYDKSTFAGDLHNLDITDAIAAPSHYATLVDANLPDGFLSNLEYPFTGGEVVPFQLAVSINKTLKDAGAKHPLIVAYGMSEIGPLSHITTMEHTLENKVGKPIPGVSARIINKSGKLVGIGEKGILEVKAPDTSMKGYLNRPELTKEFWTEDGYAKTGDIASVDENGNYTIYGRASDIFTDGDGNEHYLFDIENFLYKDSAVAEAEAVKLEIGAKEVPVAFLVLKNKLEQTDAKEILKRIYESIRINLPEAENPAGILILEKFGTNPVSTKRDYAALKLIRTGFYNLDETGLYQIDFPETGEPIKRYLAEDEEIVVYD